MCIICVSKKGIRQPLKTELKTMWEVNSDGAGYMFLNKDNRVEIHKGFMTFEDYWRSIKNENFTSDDVVIYHLRIATQGGINPQMTHPFPLTANLQDTKLLDLTCSVGIAHNGIIRLTTDRNNKEYSDTALFITRYLSKLINEPDDIEDEATLEMINKLAESKLAIMSETGQVVLLGNFFEDASGLYYSNTGYRKFTIQNVNLFDRSTWIKK